MLLRSIALTDLLSFKRLPEFELGRLNVLIGANASGKTNFIDAISLLQAAPRSLASAMQHGVRGWIWKGKPEADTAVLACDVARERGRDLRYLLSFTETDRALRIARERLEETTAPSSKKRSRVYFDRSDAEVTLGAGVPGRNGSKTMPISVSASALEVVRHPSEREITSVGGRFDAIRIYRELNTGLRSVIRNGISIQGGVTNEYLSDGGDNLAPVLSRMQRDASIKDAKTYLKRFCERFYDIGVDFASGYALAYLREEKLGEIMAPRLSDGTLKFLCLLAILFHPKPPELVCIEEPEIGLHPDALRLVAEILREGSRRMQLIVTTHSEALVDALSDDPESVVVCENHAETGTQMRRLQKQPLKRWLERYSLGELWKKGEIGGTPW